MPAGRGYLAGQTKITEAGNERYRLRTVADLSYAGLSPNGESTIGATVYAPPRTTNTVNCLLAGLIRGGCYGPPFRINITIGRLLDTDATRGFPPSAAIGYRGIPFVGRRRVGHLTLLKPSKWPSPSETFQIAVRLQTTGLLLAIGAAWRNRR